MLHNQSTKSKAGKVLMRYYKRDSVWVSIASTSCQVECLPTRYRVVVLSYFLISFFPDKRRYIQVICSCSQHRARQII
jgi:hypothetical protein